MQAVHAFFGAAHTALSSRVPYIPSVSWLEAIVTVQLVLLVAFPLAKYLYQGLCGGRWSGRKYIRAGEWALVTGGSDGIGKAYAKELMAKGMNVLILARTRANLEEACKELREGYSGSAVVDFHVADFSKPAVYPGIAAKLATLKGPISLLINNVGVSYPNPLYFSELAPMNPGFIETMVNTNLLSTVEMTSLVLPYMLSAKRGAIINISSAAGNLPSGSPLLALYSATKAAVDVFSRSLHYEVASQGVHVECQVPYFVTTKLSKIRHASLFNVTPKTYVRSSLAGLGRNGPSFVPHWSHALQDAVMQALPVPMQAAVQLSIHLGLRKAANRKREKAAAEEAAGGKVKK